MEALWAVNDSMQSGPPQPPATSSARKPGQSSASAPGAPRSAAQTWTCAIRPRACRTAPGSERSSMFWW